jgi:hypothetical protein
MSNVLASLHRLRSHTRQESGVVLRESERARDQQQERLTELTRGIRQAQAGVDPEDALGLVTYQAFRLREELRERRERARLHQKERDVALNRERYTRCVRDELSMQAVIEEKALREEEDLRRVEARNMDEVASRLRKADQ